MTEAGFESARGVSPEAYLERLLHGTEQTPNGGGDTGGPPIWFVAVGAIDALANIGAISDDSARDWIARFAVATGQSVGVRDEFPLTEHHESAFRFAEAQQIIPLVIGTQDAQAVSLEVFPRVAILRWQSTQYPLRADAIRLVDEFGKEFKPLGSAEATVSRGITIRATAFQLPEPAARRTTIEFFGLSREVLLRNGHSA